MPSYTITINGAKRIVEAPPGETLLTTLRDRFELTGAKAGCGEGMCGACTVLLDGEPVHACLTPVSDAHNRTVITIEGLARGASLHPVQQAFLDAGAFQCGYCTPGMILEAVALLRRNPKPSIADVRQAMDGHICRCGAYPRIVDAVRMVSRG